MKTVAKVIGVSRSNLAERLQERPQSRIGRPPLPEEELVAQIKAVICELPTYGYRRVHAILKESGWSEIDIRPIDVTCTLPEQELIRYGTRFGPVGIALQEADPQTRTQVAAAVRAAFDPYVHGPEVRFTAACWMMIATSP